MALTPPQTMLVWVLSGDLWFGRRELLFDVRLQGKPHARRPKLLTSDQEAKLIATRLSSPPKGYANWTLQLLADRIVELRIVPAIRTQTVRRTLKKRHDQPQDWILGDPAAGRCGVRGGNESGA